ncbi:TonB-dependent receptor [bacterium]|nr:TonB-dependent receptor [bacterium]
MLRNIFLLIVALSFAAFLRADEQRTYIGEELEVVGEREFFQSQDSVDMSSEMNSSVLDAAKNLSPALFFTRRALLGYGVASGAAGKTNLMGLGGSPTTQIAFIFDGDPLWMGIMGHPVYDAMNVFRAQKVSLIEGAAPVMFGANAMGGAVAVETYRRSKAGIEGIFDGQYGAFDSRNAKAGIDGNVKDVDFGVNYSSDHTDGYRTDADDSYSSERWGTHIGYRNGKNDLFFSVHRDWFSLYDPGTIDAPKEDAWYRITREHFHARVKHSFENTSVEISAFMHDGKHSIYDGFRSDDNSWGTKLFVLHSIKGGEFGLKLTTLQMGGEAKKNDIDFGRHWTDDYSASAYFQYSFGKLRTNIGSAAFYRKNFDAHISPEITVSYLVEKHISPYIRIANGFRFPSLRETNIFPWSNPDLLPENSWTGQLGTHFNINMLNGRIFVWHTYAENLIVDGYPEHPFRNSETFDRTGITTEIKVALHRTISLDVGYSYQQLRERTSISPAHHFTGGIFYRRKIFVPVKISLMWDGAKDLFASDNEKDKLPDYLVADARISVKPVKWLSFNFAVDNIADIEYFTQKGYPMPPRTFWGGITLNKK